MEILKYILIGLFAAVILAGLIISVIRNNKIRKNGKKTTAVITRVEEHDSVDSDGMITTTYANYAEYTADDGSRVEVRLGNIMNKKHAVGEEITIMYDPEKPNYAIQIKK